MDGYFSEERSSLFVSLSSLIIWIASDGGAKSHQISDALNREAALTLSDDASPERAAFAEIFKKATADFALAAFDRKIKIKGFPNGDRSVAREIVPNDVFGKLSAYGYPFCPDEDTFDCLTSREKDRLFISIDGGHIEIERREIWSGLIVEKSDAQKLWPPRAKSTPSYSDEEALAVLREAMEKNDGFISQNDGAKVVRGKLPGFNSDRAKTLTKGLTGNEKQGPRGPRKNRAK